MVIDTVRMMKMIFGIVQEEWVECENEEFKIWVSMKVPDGWKGMFKCGLRVMKDVVEVRNTNEKLK